MSEILSTAIVLVVMVAAFAGTIAWVRRDSFTSTQYRRPALPDSPASVERNRNAPSIRPGVLRIN